MATLWFLLMSSLTLLALVVGCMLARGSKTIARLTLALALMLLFLWVYLIHTPALAVLVIPPSILTYLEGTAAAPLFMIVIGCALAFAHLPRQRRLVKIAMLCGLFYFLNGGFWMLQTTPTAVLGRDLPTDGAILQSQNYSCVAAACATALVRLGINTTEAEMAEFTQTRSGSGATLIRALDGLERRLAGTRYQPRLLQPGYDELMLMPTPIVTPIAVERSGRHMITLLRFNRYGAWLVDPVVGEFFMVHEDLRQSYTGQVIIFVPR